MRSILLALIISLPLWAKTASKPLVVTAVPALSAIAKELTVNTDIEIANPLGNDLPMQEITETIKGDPAKLDSLAPKITAVLSLRSIMPGDYLYLALRQRNIRIIEIDAASPLNPTLTAVGTIRENGHVNPYIWLAPSAVIRSAEIIGKDLEALFPADAKTIEANLQKLRQEIRSLQNEYEQKFLTLDRFEAATMDHSFDYLLKDINLFVTLALPGEMSWGDKEMKQFKAGLESESFKTVIHRWVPFGDMAGLAEKAGVSFTVMNTGFPGATHFDKGVTAFLRANLESLWNGLK